MDGARSLALPMVRLAVAIALSALAGWLLGPLLPVVVGTPTDGGAAEPASP